MKFIYRAKGRVLDKMKSREERKKRKNKNEDIVEKEWLYN